MFNLSYLLKANIIAIALYALFVLLFRKDTFFKGKRIFLLATCMIPFVLPLIHLPETEQSYGNVASFIQNNINLLNEKSDVDTNTSLFFPIIHILEPIYLIVSILLFLKIALQSITILYRIKNMRWINYKGIKIHLSVKNMQSFSFFQLIVVNSQSIKSGRGEEILAHERAHAVQLHSLDVMLSSIFASILWFNPVAWFIKKEITINLEYLADRAVVEMGYEKRGYQLHLLKMTYSRAIASLTNNFNVSHLKKRIDMMNKSKTSKTAMIKYLLIAPITAGLILLNTGKATASLSQYDRVSETDSVTTNMRTMKTIKAAKISVKKEKGSKEKDTDVRAQEKAGNSNSSKDESDIVVTGKKRETINSQNSLGKQFTRGISGTESTSSLDKALIVVDGRETDHSELSKINSADIQSISVLKNESATSQYGEKGKDGVILIEMKMKKKK